MHYTPEQLEQFPWHCSHGTMRPDHLAAAYLRTLDNICALGIQSAQLGEGDRAELAALANRADEPVGDEPTDAAWLSLNNAEMLLAELAPVGFYFGGNWGDGSDFGFWITEEWCEALEERGLNPDGTPADVAKLLQAFDDHGITEETLCDAYCGTAQGWSEEQAGADYAQGLAEELGLAEQIGNGGWPLSCIDWQAAWRELELGDGYALIPADGAGTFHVVRSV